MLKAFPRLVDEIVSTANLNQYGKYERYQVWQVFFENVKDATNMHHKIKEWTKSDLERNLKRHYNKPVVAIQHLANTDGLFHDCITSLKHQIPLGKHIFGKYFFEDFIDCLQADFGPDSPIQTTKGEYEWLGGILEKANKNTPEEDSTMIILKILDLLLLNALLGPNEYLFTALGATTEIIADTPGDLSNDNAESIPEHSASGKLTLKGISLTNGLTQPFESTKQEWSCKYKTVVIGRRPDKAEYSADIEIPICSVFHNNVSRNQLLVKYDHEKQQWKAINLSKLRTVTIARRGELNPDFHYILQCSQDNALNSCSLSHGDIIYFDNDSLSLRVELED